MPFVDLLLMKYIPGTAVPVGFAAIDTGAKVIRINQLDYPLTGGKAEIFSIIPYALGESTNASIANQIAEGENFGSDGRIQLLIKRPDLDNDYGCSIAAANEVGLKTQPEVTLIIVTRENGWDLGDEVRFIDENANPAINILLTVQNISEVYKSVIGMIEDIEYTITCANYIVDPTSLIGSAYSLSSLPQLRPGADIVTP